MRRDLALLLLGASLAALWVSPSDARALPRARDGVAPFAFVWGWSQETERLGARVPLAIANQRESVHLLDAVRPRPLVLAYMHAHLSTWDAWRADAEAHEDAFAHTDAGRRIRSQAGFTLMDPGAAAWRRILAKGARDYLDLGADGVFVDGASREASTQLPDGRVAPEIEARWSKDTAGLLRALREALGARGSVAYNGLHEDWLPFTRAADGALLEGYVARPWSPGGIADSTLWRRTQEAVLHAQPTGRAQLLYAVGDPDDARLRVYALASYLLVRGSRTYFAYGVDARTTGYFPEWDVKLGRALAPVTSIAGTRLASGLFRRRFAHGVVYVNPSSTRAITTRLAAPRRLVVPSGGSLAALGGNGRLTTRRVRAVTLPPRSGAILLD